MTDDMEITEEQQAAARAEVALELKVKRDAELEDLRKVMDTREGRRVFNRLLAHCKVFESTFSTEALIMARDEGARAEGLFWLNELDEACPASALAMLQESKRQD